MLPAIMPNEAHVAEPESPHETVDKGHFLGFFKILSFKISGLRIQMFGIVGCSTVSTTPCS
jgi:hypothetical protein